MIRITQVYDRNSYQKMSDNQHFLKNLREGLWVSILIPWKVNKAVIELFKTPHTNPPLYVM